MTPLLAALIFGLGTTSTTMQNIPRPEHPRPDLQRSEWLNLNGQWEFAETDEDGGGPDRAFPDKITVPFCRESALSGLGRKGFVKNVWYRRTFQRPASWKSPRTLFHIGASDWRTTVYVNGKKAGEHTGGQTPIDLDVTALLQKGDNTVVVHAYDDTRSGLQALGKQCPEPDSYGCLYTRTTGIWQTVWLEGVGSSYVPNAAIYAKLENSEFAIRAVPSGDAADKVRAIVRANGKEVGRGEADPNVMPFYGFNVQIPKPHLWTPEDPFLYDVEIQTLNEGKVVDTVHTYAGMRSVRIDGHKILINGKPVFQRLILDQGFYPDGIWTAPSERALKHDIEMSMAAGFNGARLHQKVFEPRYLYLADKMGYLVWGEFPNWGLNFKDERVNQPVIDEWKQIVARDRSHPSIIGWCPFNETPQEAIPLQNEVAALTRELDSRPVIDTSGWSHGIADPEVMDTHDYDQNPQTFKDRYMRYFEESGLPIQYAGPKHTGIPFMVSEFGGIGWSVEQGWGYGSAPKSLDEFYARFKGLADALLDNPNMFGFCYTQLTDVEQERNGLYKYDRTPKFDMAKLKSYLNRPAAYEKGDAATAKPPHVDWTVLVGSTRDTNHASWHYSLETPPDAWNQSSFDDSGWKSGPGGFGAKEGWEKSTGTPWASKDIWIRQKFAYDGAKFDQAMLAIHFDNGVEVYVNGQAIWVSDKGAWNDSYEGKPVTEALRKALVNGENTIAIHCHQDTGGQFIDAGLLIGTKAK